MDSSCEICKGALVKFTEPIVIESTGYIYTPATWRCLACGLVQVRFASQVGAEAWRGYYERDGDYHRECVLAGFDSFDARLAHDLRLARIRVENLSRFLSRGNLLDVGTSNGALPTVACELGFAAFGIEPDEWVVQEARAHGAHVMPGIFEDYVKCLPDASMDVVTFIDSFEHLLHPAPVLEQTHRVLGRGGLIVIEMPDADAPGFAEQGAEWKHFKPREHAYLYGKRHVEMLLKEHRFRLLDTIAPYPDRRVYYARRLGRWAWF